MITYIYDCGTFMKMTNTPTKSNTDIEDNNKHVNLHTLVYKLTNNLTDYIPREKLHSYPALNWGNNGVGDRWAKKRFNYCVLYRGNGGIKYYCENDKEYVIDNDIIKTCTKNTTIKRNGIIGIFVFSKRTNIPSRPIRNSIRSQIITQQCVMCGTTSSVECDHKNDLYNDPRVLDSIQQNIDDFQPLCRHCNLVKRQIHVKEMAYNEGKRDDEKKIYSVKNLPQFSWVSFPIPWEMKVFDISDPSTKMDTYWYDPIEFQTKLQDYYKTLLIIHEIKNRVRRR